MEFDEVVRTRRSIRKFSAADVPDALLAVLIDSAVRAPSSMNGQPWCFIVVRSAETKMRLARTKDKYCPPEKREYPAGFLREAPVVVVTCVERAKAYDRGIESGVLATGHLLLAAANHGLTGVYMSAYKTGAPELADEIRAILGLPADIDPITILPIGYPGGMAEPKTVRHAEEVLHREAFGRK
ncbi:MAG: nitroreductase family protein [bacterium]|jgi:nitroreductase